MQICHILNQSMDVYIIHQNNVKDFSQFVWKQSNILRIHNNISGLVPPPFYWLEGPASE